VVGRVSGNGPGSLGLHPAVYFYSERGRHIPDLLLGMLLLVRQRLDSNDNGFFKKFTTIRGHLETYLLSNKGLITQALQLARSSTRYERARDLFSFLIDIYSSGKTFTDEQMIQVIAPNSVAKILAVSEAPGGAKFSEETKSGIFIKQAFQAAMKCPICDGYVDPTKSASYDHILRVQDGGTGASENGQITHPYCNTGFKN
jgi:hypothetical protein